MEPPNKILFRCLRMVSPTMAKKNGTDSVYMHQPLSLSDSDHSDDSGHNSCYSFKLAEARAAEIGSATRVVSS